MNSGAPRSEELHVSQDQVCEAGAREGGQVGLGWVERVARSEKSVWVLIWENWAASGGDLSKGSVTWLGVCA